MSKNILNPVTFYHFFKYCIFCASSICIGLGMVYSTAHAETRNQLTPTTFETTLTNGLKVIIREDHRSPMVMTQIWYKVGSSDESGNILGISHALEHMMFKGTNKVPKDEFTRLSRIYGGSINAATIIINSIPKPIFQWPWN